MHSDANFRGSRFNDDGFGLKVTDRVLTMQILYRILMEKCAERKLPLNRDREVCAERTISSIMWSIGKEFAIVKTRTD